MAQAEPHKGTSVPFFHRGFDFEAAVQAPFRMQPGLRRRAAEASLLTPCAAGSRHLEARLAVLAGAADTALLQQPGFDAAPPLARLAAALAQAHPAAWCVSGPAWQALQLGWSVEQASGLVQSLGGPQAVGDVLQALPPGWRAAALLALAVQEDLALVDGRSATLPWLAVALPSHWRPADKIGRHFAEVHAPVADNTLLLAAGAHLMRLVSSAERWERFVWTLTPHAGLDAHPDRCQPAWPDDPLAVPEAAHWRSEHQTFWPLGDGLALFTIHVDCAPMAQALTAPAHARRVHAALASMSPAVLAYRGLTHAQAPLLQWLQRHGAP